MSRNFLVFIAAACLAAGTAEPAASGNWAAEFHVTGPDALVARILAWDGSVVIGGSFGHIGRTPAHRIAQRLDDGTWQQLGQSLPITGVRDFCVHDGSLHVLGGVSGGARVWRLDGGNWQPVGDVIASAIVLASYAGELYAGAYRWQDGEWVDVLHADRAVHSLAVHDGRLWIGGGFRSAGGVPAYNLTHYISVTTGVPDEVPLAPALALAAAPNPFNPVTTLHFALPADARVRLEIYDVAGRRIEVLLDEHRRSGEHTATWQGTDRQGRPLPSGTYLVRLRAGTTSVSARIALVR